MARTVIRNGETRTTEVILGGRDALYIQPQGALQVEGSDFAVRMRMPGAVLENLGLIEGVYGVLADAGVAIENSSRIVSHISAFYHQSAVGISSVINTGYMSGNVPILSNSIIDIESSGRIDGGLRAISIAGGNIHLSTASIVTSFAGPTIYATGPGGSAIAPTFLENYGLIQGGGAAVRFEGNQSDTVINYGEIRINQPGSPIMAAGDGNDLVRNRGTIVGDVDLGSGNDILHNGGTLSGTVRGGDGLDRIYGGVSTSSMDGGAGADRLIGGAGQDTFIISSAADSSARLSSEDRIFRFDAARDTIDLTAVDANIGTSVDEAFPLIGGAAFSGTAGELRIDEYDGRLRVLGDVDGDARADLTIILVGQTDPAAIAFLL